MSAIYFHIPICKTRCSYCTFYSTTAHNEQDRLIDNMLCEFRERNNFLKDRNIESIYLGGGTPSMLTLQNISRLLNEACTLYDINKSKTEITLEANPDDLNDAYLLGLLGMGISRLSIGIQSFDNTVLKQANRRHTGEIAINAVSRAAKLGFKNISIDLMYGFTEQTNESWISTVKQAITLPIQHISAYELTYENGTVLDKQRQAGKLKPTDDDTINDMHDTMVSMLAQKGFVQYEVSNFALSGYHSRHNSSYWCGTHYLGIGPAAHSYDGKTRSWNIASLQGYIKAIQHNEEHSECEILSHKDIYNELIMLSLRTTQGINLRQVNELGSDKLEFCLQMAQKHIALGDLQITNDYLRATTQGMKLLNLISEHLMLE